MVKESILENAYGKLVLLMDRKGNPIYEGRLGYVTNERTVYIMVTESPIPGSVIENRKEVPINKIGSLKVIMDPTEFD